MVEIIREVERKFELKFQIFIQILAFVSILWSTFRAIDFYHGKFLHWIILMVDSLLLEHTMSNKSCLLLLLLLLIHSICLVHCKFYTASNHLKDLLLFEIKLKDHLKIFVKVRFPSQDLPLLTTLLPFIFGPPLIFGGGWLKIRGAEKV